MLELLLWAERSRPAHGQVSVLPLEAAESWHVHTPPTWVSGTGKLSQRVEVGSINRFLIPEECGQGNLYLLHRLTNACVT